MKESAGSSAPGIEANADKLILFFERSDRARLKPARRGGGAALPWTLDVER
jgi:hypothetical protein